MGWEIFLRYNWRIDKRYYLYWQKKRSLNILTKRYLCSHLKRSSVSCKIAKDGPYLFFFFFSYPQKFKINKQSWSIVWATAHHFSQTVIIDMHYACLYSIFFLSQNFYYSFFPFPSYHLLFMNILSLSNHLISFFFFFLYKYF